MTGPEPLIVEREERNPGRSTWIGAVITTACVAGGCTAALFTLSSVTASAIDVATAYLEARLAGNPSEAWGLECKATRSYVGSYDRYVEHVAYWDDNLELPAHVEVALGDLHSARVPGGFPTIAATVTSADRSDWAITGELPLFFDDGRFEVCDAGLGHLGLD
jgi:hypothetical protein